MLSSGLLKPLGRVGQPQISGGQILLPLYPLMTLTNSLSDLFIPGLGHESKLCAPSAQIKIAGKRVRAPEHSYISRRYLQHKCWWTTLFRGIISRYGLYGLAIECSTSRLPKKRCLLTPGLLQQALRKLRPGAAKGIKDLQESSLLMGRIPTILDIEPLQYWTILNIKYFVEYWTLLWMNYWWLVSLMGIPILMGVWDNF